MFRKHGNNLVINNRGRNTINVHHHKVTDGFNFAHNSTPNHKTITNVTQRNSPEINCNHPCNMATYNFVCIGFASQSCKIGSKIKKEIIPPT